jgi:integrase
VTETTVTSRARRDTGWRKDGKARGIYWRPKALGKAWGFYNPRIGRVEGGCYTRQEAIDKQAKARLDKSAGLPAPDTRTLVRDLVEELREAKRSRLRKSSFAEFERVLDTAILPDLGHLKPAQCGPDRVARFIRDLEAKGLSGATITKYVRPLGAVFKLAIRRGMIAANPLSLLSDDERPKASTRRPRFEWTPETIARLITAAEQLASRPESRFDYSGLVRLLALTGLRVGEALALTWENVDLLCASLRVRYTLGRDGSLGEPKTAAGEREVPLSPGLVELLLRLKPEDAGDHEFVFAGRNGKPVSYWNFRSRGFAKALETAELAGNGITVHDLRHAAASVYIASGLTPVEVADVLGHTDASFTLRVYAHLFNRPDAAERVRAAQESIPIHPTTKDH